ncbi:hypothetical protein CHS0354_014365 [Potamilus streckersoni]|uniref:Uncharacterized protein n=1 Tax=Potamilus streckersoni TaxID=2493646 RepID=A0AAE0VXP3_9BIVA|nr:hypothetical protein CHS0354_014365 [Potamilus streckersoni]
MSKASIFIVFLVCTLMVIHFTAAQVRLPDICQCRRYCLNGEREDGPCGIYDPYGSNSRSVRCCPIYY